MLNTRVIDVRLSGGQKAGQRWQCCHRCPKS